MVLHVLSFCVFSVFLVPTLPLNRSSECVRATRHWVPIPLRFLFRLVRLLPPHSLPSLPTLLFSVFLKTLGPVFHCIPGLFRSWVAFGAFRRLFALNFELLISKHLVLLSVFWRHLNKTLLSYTRDLHHCFLLISIQSVYSANSSYLSRFRADNSNSRTCLGCENSQTGKRSLSTPTRIPKNLLSKILFNNMKIIVDMAKPIWTDMVDMDRYGRYGPTWPIWWIPPIWLNSHIGHPNLFESPKTDMEIILSKQPYRFETDMADMEKKTTSLRKTDMADMCDWGDIPQYRPNPNYLT